MPSQNLLVHLSPEEREYFNLQEYREQEGFRPEDYEDYPQNYTEREMFPNQVSDEEFFGSDNPK